MNAFNTGITQLFDFLLIPFASLRPVYGLCFLSFLSGVLLLKLFGMVSNQEKIRRAKDRIQAYVYEVVLYNNQFVLTWKGILNILKSNVVYLSHAVLPMFILVVPCVLILAQLNLRYDAHPVQVGQTFLVKVKVSEGTNLSQVTLEDSEALHKASKPLKIPSEGEIDWLVEASQEGSSLLVVSYDNKAYKKEVIVGGKRGKLPRARNKQGLQALLYPGEESFIRDSRIESFQVEYPKQASGFSHWLVVFLVVSIGSGFLLKDFLGVEI